MKNSLFQGQQSEEKVRKKQGVGFSQALAPKSGLEERGLSWELGGNWSAERCLWWDGVELQSTLVTGLVCMGSKVISTCQSIDMINTIILGGH